MKRKGGFHGTAPQSRAMSTPPGTERPAHSFLKLFWAPVKLLERGPEHSGGLEHTSMSIASGKIHRRA